jgi:hypothetical protein
MTPFEPRPILVTGMARSGTTWVGRMLSAGGQTGYVNEPFNLSTGPGTVRVPVQHWYPYISAENERIILPPLEDALRFRYPLGRELLRCRTRIDLLHTAKVWRDSRRFRGRRPLVKEPHAVFSAEWFADRLGSDVVVTVRHPGAVVASWKRLDWDFDFANLLEQPALVRDHLSSFVPEMQAALAPERDLVDRVALLWRVVYAAVAEYGRRFRVLVVRQEDMSRDPLGGYKRLYEDVGLSFTSEAASTVAASSNRANPKETRVESPHDTRLDSVANLAAWRPRLTDEEIGRVRQITADTAALYYPELEW